MNKYLRHTRLPLLTATLASTLSLGACVAYPVAPARPGVDQGIVSGGFGAPAPTYSYTPAPSYSYTPAPSYTYTPPSTVYYDEYYSAPYYAPSYGPAYGYYGPSASFYYYNGGRDRRPYYPPPGGYGGGGYHGGGGGGGGGGSHSGGGSRESPLAPAFRGLFNKPGRDR